MQKTGVSGTKLVPQERMQRTGVHGQAYHGARAHRLFESGEDPADFSPSVANHLAGLIVNHWYACLAAKEIRPDTTLDILDFAPGAGRGTLLMTRALQRKTSTAGVFRWRYLPVMFDHRDIARMQALEEVQDLVTEERLVPLFWFGASDGNAILCFEDLKQWQPANPVVMLMHDAFSHWYHRLFAVHYGKLMEYANAMTVCKEPDTECDADAAPGDSSDESRRWVAADLSTIDPDVPELLQNYLAKFNSAPVPYPQAALAMIDLIRSHCGQGCLMIASAPGMTSEAELRLANFAELTKRFQSDQPMPVNFHMLAYKIARSNAATDCLRLHKNQLIQISLFSHGEADARMGALMRDVDPGMFGHASALSQAMQGVNGDSAFEHRLTLLKIAAFDPGVLAAIHGPHFSKASKHPGFNREGWRQALDQAWANYLPDDKSSRFHERIAMMAMCCGHWSLARRALKSGLQHGGPNATDLAQLAWCDARTGLLRQAADKVAEALALDHVNVLALEVMQRVHQRLAGWHGVWRQPLDHPELPLVLEPLDASHAEAMLYQYRDPQIAIMTGLPAMTTLESMQQWIDEQIREKTWAHYCIMHRDLGFVGYINLAISEHAAFFCFWTGVDFQGRGWATQAGKLACEYARQSGVSVMLTSAYLDNQRSINALKRIGFSEIPIRAVPPDHERIFYALTSDSAPEIDFVSELKNYYLREKISLSFPDADTGGFTQTLKENGDGCIR